MISCGKKLLSKYMMTRKGGVRKDNVNAAGSIQSNRRWQQHQYRPCPQHLPSFRSPCFQSFLLSVYPKAASIRLITLSAEGLGIIKRNNDKINKRSGLKQRKSEA